MRFGLIGLGLVLLVPSGCGQEPERVPAAYGAEPGPEGRVVVEVLNASGISGLAREGTRQLRRQGIDVVYYGNAEEDLDSTRVLVRRGAGDRGARVARALGLGIVGRAEDTLRRVDVTVLLGRDFTPPPRFAP